MNPFPMMCTLADAQTNLFIAFSKCSIPELDKAIHEAHLALKKYERYKQHSRDIQFLQMQASEMKATIAIYTAYVLLANKLSSVKDFFDELHKKPDDQLLFKSDTYEHNDVTIALNKGLKEWRKDVLKNTFKRPDHTCTCPKYGYYYPEILRIKQLQLKS